MADLDPTPLDTAEMEELADKIEDDEELTEAEMERLEAQVEVTAEAASEMAEAMTEAFRPMVEQMDEAMGEISEAFADAFADADIEEVLEAVEEADERKNLVHRSELAQKVILKQRKETGMNMVHRLRDWERGDTIWGFDIQSENGSTTGKTFDRSRRLPDDSDPFVETVEQRMAQTLEMVKKPAVGFVWVGTIEKVTTEGHDHSDPGEPPLKHASISDVCVKTVVTAES